MLQFSFSTKWYHMRGLGFLYIEAAGPVAAKKVIGNPSRSYIELSLILSSDTVVLLVLTPPWFVNTTILYPSAMSRLSLDGTLSCHNYQSLTFRGNVLPVFVFIKVQSMSNAAILALSVTSPIWATIKPSLMSKLDVVSILDLFTTPWVNFYSSYMIS